MKKGTILSTLAALFFTVAMCTIACNLTTPPQAAAPTAEDPNLAQLHKSIDVSSFEKFGITGCLAPAKNNEKVSASPYTMQSIYNICMREIDAASVEREKVKAPAAKLSAEQLYLNLCIDTAVGLGPIPKNDEQGKQVIEYCKKELEAYKQTLQ